MSNWPQAVWIVRKLQKNFDFDAKFNSYTSQFNNNATMINGYIAQTKTNVDTLKNKVMTFASTKDGNNNTPADPPSNFGNGTVWFILEG